METEDIFQWLARELAQERVELEARHGTLLKELSRRLGPGSPKGPLSALEVIRLADMAEQPTQSETEDLNCENIHHAESGPGLAAVEASLVQELDEELHKEEQEAREQEKKKDKLHKKEQSELSNTLRRKSQVAKYAEQSWLKPLWITQSAAFELTFALCILFHAALMAGELQYRAMDVGFHINYEHYTIKSHEAFPGMKEFFDVCEWIFGILFWIEAILKLMSLRNAFFKEMWNCFDFLLCVLWVVDRALQNMPFDTSMLRLLRLARLLRLVKLARTVQGFDALAVMTTSLQGSVQALIWVAVLLILVQMTFALLLSQVLLFYIEDDSQELDDRKAVFEYFGNFTRAMLTMFEITLGNWPPVARLLQEKVSPYFVIFSIGHKIIFGFACLAVINGVFMQETFKVAQQDDQIMLRTVETKRQAHRRKMQMFFQHANDDDDNILSIEEWKEVINEEKVKHWFAAQGLSISDPELLWKILDTSGDRQLDLEELIQGTARLQGFAKSLDLAVLTLEQRSLQTQAKEIRQSVEMIRQQVGMLLRTSIDASSTPGVRC
ncbi:Sodium channel protein type 11 subunit alpha (Peripheral nerve sodium channel 5) (PN5) (Sensory neuron sodium channel 2) (Sodium channel protein type XI subunit alpha) (Voltage-gated sodium channel subunit alpha Nav1.9) (hNaN) [Durusdinium trenchii]|uniref:Ion transport domain-containing protein n=2 Tax=Durusdinium trenchii TaxID=1381693 RepID=A0ABP0MAM1_9DINO